MKYSWGGSQDSLDDNWDDPRPSNRLFPEPHEAGFHQSYEVKTNKAHDDFLMIKSCCLLKVTCFFGIYLPMGSMYYLGLYGIYLPTNTNLVEICMVKINNAHLKVDGFSSRPYPFVANRVISGRVWNSTIHMLGIAWICFTAI